MHRFVAYAQPAEAGDISLRLILLWIGIVMGAALLAFIPARIARVRRSRHAEIITAFSVLWALAVAMSVINASMAQAKWSRERLVRIQSGYYDIKNDVETLPPPWTQWVVLGGVYGVLMVGASIRTKSIADRRSL